MTQDFVNTSAVRALLDKATRQDSAEGNPRLKAILRDLLEATMRVIMRHDISENEFWTAASYIAGVGHEAGLVAPGRGAGAFPRPLYGRQR